MKVDPLICAARLSNPWGDDAFPELDEESALKIACMLKSNGVSFLAIKKKFRGIISPPFGRYVAGEETRYERLRNEFGRIITVFEREGIRAVLIKSSGLYPSFPHLSSNLDVLVEPERADTARKLLCGLGYVELLNVEEPGKFLFRRFVGDGPSYTFHLHEEVGWGVPFVEASEIWANARRAEDDEELLIPGPRESLLITLSHWFYEDKLLSLGNLYTTAQAVRASSGSISQAAGSAAQRGWEDGFFASLRIFNESWRRIFQSDFVGKGELETVDAYLEGKTLLRSSVLSRVRYLEGYPAAIPFLANKIFYYRKVARDRRRSYPTRVKDCAKTVLWAIRWKLHIRSQRPLLVAISGCDGSGKTTQAGRLKGVLEEADIRTILLWARGGSSLFMGFWVGLAKKLVRPLVGASRGSSGKRSEEEKIVFRRKVMQSPLLRFLYAVFYVLDLGFVYWVKARLLLLVGSVVICDRYVADAEVDFALASGGKGGKLPFSVKLLRTFAPKANLYFLLDVREEDALGRKPEEGGIAHLFSSRRMFKDLASSLSMTVMDPTLPLEEIHEIIAEKTLASFYNRYGSFINCLLFSNPEQLNPGRWRAGRA